MLSGRCLSLGLVLLLAIPATADTAPTWKAGAARSKITPDKPLWMSGYSSRTKPAEGTLIDLWAKALILEDPDGKRVALVTLDLVGIPRDLSVAVCADITRKYKLPRECICLSVSHTHTGPVVGNNLSAMYFLDDEQQKLVADYAKALHTKIVDVVGSAIEKLAPADLTRGNGYVTFAVNRRNNKEPDVPKMRDLGQLKGPIDHDVPVLCVRDKAGRVKAVLFGYACHSTVLAFYQWSGDYPGFAQIALEKAHPDAVALFWAGCGADQNPLPRRTVEFAQKYGEELARGVESVLAAPMTPISGKLSAAYAEVPLAFADLPSRDKLVEDSTNKDRFIAARAKLLLQKIKDKGSLAGTYPYPVQVWQLGRDLTFVTLGGEVVVDYSLRLKKELGRDNTWVASYSNDVMAYIPSLRVLKEGGYEGGGAMVYYGLPTVWGAKVEETIVGAVHEQVKKASKDLSFREPINRTDKVPILLDTDIGNDVDDAFALALALASPEIDLVAVTTVAEGAEDRAWMVCRLLTAVGRRDIPVAWGRNPQPKSPIEGQIQYRRHPGVIFNRTVKPVKESAVELLYAKLKAQPGKLTIVAVGPLTNIAALLKEHPDCKPWIKRIVIMGGSVRVGYDGKKTPEAEWNIKLDPAAARAVFTAGVPLVVAPLDATGTVKLEEPLRRKLFAACTPLTFQVQALYQLWDQPTPILFDPVAVALSFTEQFCTMEDLHLEVDDKGFTRIGKDKANARVATAIKGDDFLKWYVERVSAGEKVLPKEPGNRSEVIARGGMPNRVHCFEDYETDIEKRWWMSGKAETKNVAPGGGKRACRGVLTQDFDDLQGDMKTMYTAVIFNPVPGPPMGKNPRLSFRYWLKGTDTLRVQIYSLTKGYHRYLSLTGLPQEKWQEATVDMTKVRRPDGTGGPLSEDERIDDVQFYVDPRAELIIDDMVLYDAAVPGEKRPFPKRILYTGWFDTGKQGKEWPGSFEIVDKKGYFWKAAKSVVDKDTGEPMIRLHLPGERFCGTATQLFFRYRLNKSDSLTVGLSNTRRNEALLAYVDNLKKDAWTEATVSFNTRKLHPGNPIELAFALTKGGELLIDDVLLYEPGEK